MVFVMVALASIFFFAAIRSSVISSPFCSVSTDGKRRNPNRDKRWYIVHAYSNFEKKVAESIREQSKQRGLDELFEQVLVPTEKVTEVRRGRKVDAERKFFPGYVLVKMKLTDEAFHLIKNTPKVTGFLAQKTSRCRSRRPRPCGSCTGAGRRGTPEGLGVVRDRRECAGGRWAVRIVLRRGRGNRRGAFAREGRGVDLRRATPVELEFAQVEKV